ncbi:hypothetical protein WA158_005929 [Blastocystis sp. Blastoise]
MNQNIYELAAETSLNTYIPLWVIGTISGGFIVVSLFFALIGFNIHEKPIYRKYILDVFTPLLAVYIFSLGINTCYSVLMIDIDDHSHANNTVAALSQGVVRLLEEKEEHQHGSSRAIGLANSVGFMVEFCFIQLASFIMDKKLPHILPNKVHDKPYYDNHQKETIYVTISQFISMCFVLGTFGALKDMNGFFYLYLIQITLLLCGISYFFGAALKVLDTTPIKFYIFYACFILSGILCLFIGYYGIAALLTVMEQYSISYFIAFFIGWQFHLLFKCVSDYNMNESSIIAGILCAIFIVGYYYLSILFV